MSAPVKILQLETLLYRIEASIGSSIFRSVFAEVDGERKDILRDGQVSCAVYVSSLLVLAERLNQVRATVSSLEKGMIDNAWTTTDKPIPGAVVIWDSALQSGGEMHEHAGFVLNETEAVSHSDRELSPMRHHITYGTEDGKPTRRVKAIYIHPKLHTV